MRRGRQHRHLGSGPLRQLIPLALLLAAVTPAAPRGAAELGLPRWAPAWSALAMDVDNDGAVELSTVSHGTLPVWFRLSDGRFSAAPDDPWQKDRGDRHGMAPCDVDRDGDYELLVGAGGRRGAGGAAAELWVRGADGRWKDEGAALLAKSEGARMRGVSCADLDGDGDPELWFHAFGEARANLVFQRNPDGSYTDIAGALGVGTAQSSVGAQLGDLDGDGDLDAVRLLEAQVQVLLRGKDGVYQPSPQDFGMKFTRDVELLDVDGDLDLDLYVARAWNEADGASDGVFQFDLSAKDTDRATYTLPAGCDSARVRARGSFDGGAVEIVTAESSQKQSNRVKLDPKFAVKPEAPGALLVWADPATRAVTLESGGVDGQVVGRLVCGDEESPGPQPALLSAELDPKAAPDRADALWLNDGHGVFTRAKLPDLSAAPDTIDVVSLDVELDGDLDLFLVTAAAPGSMQNERDWLLLNDGRGQFTPSELWRPPATEPIHEGVLGLATDLNGDRYPDLIVFNGAHHGVMAGELQTWLNPGSGGNWLVVEVFDGPARALSATVEVRAAGRAARRLSNPAPDWRSNGGQTGVFGLGSATVADQVTVRWPDGATVALERVPAGQVLRVEHPR